MAEMTGGELLVRCLHAERVRFVHAITDGTYMMVLEALERLGDELGIRLVVPRHEAAGAHAADAQTRITGEPAVVMACAGPGAANLLSALVNAQAEGSPVVAKAAAHDVGEPGGRHGRCRVQLAHRDRLPDCSNHTVRHLATASGSWLLFGSSCDTKRIVARDG